MEFVLILFYLLFPIFLIFMAQKLSMLDKVGLVVLAFAGGIGLSILVDLSRITGLSDVVSVQTQLTEISIALAIPLLVMSMDVKRSLTLAGSTLLSMFFAVLGVVLLANILAFVFHDELDHMWQIASMAIGAYVGGGPNMAAIKVAIEGDQSVFMLMTSYDILLSAIYLLFVMTLAKPLFSLFLTHSARHRGDTSVSNTTSVSDSGFEHLSDETANAYRKILEKGRRLESVKALFVAIVVVGVALALSSILPDAISGSAAVICITTLGVAVSFVPAIRQLKNAFQFGMYWVLVFCFTMGSMTNIDMLMNINWHLFAYIALIMIGAMVFHACLCRFFKIDVDTFLIASSAAIMSVPFIPAIAGALKNKSLIIPGFAIAILGYVVGNYLGVLSAHFLKAQGLI